MKTREPSKAMTKMYHHNISTLLMCLRDCVIKVKEMRQAAAAGFHIIKGLICYPRV